MGSLCGLQTPFLYSMHRQLCCHSSIQDCHSCTKTFADVELMDHQTKTRCCLVRSPA